MIFERSRLIYPLILFTSLLPLQSQSLMERTSVRIGAGYSSFALGDAASLFQTVISVYQSGGKPMKVETSFPLSPSFHAGLGFEVSPQIIFGCSGGYAATRATASYRSIAERGTVFSDVRMTGMDAYIEFSPASSWGLRPVFRTGAGLVSVSYYLVQRLYDSDGVQNFESYVHASGSALRWSGSVGLAADLSPVQIQLFAGFHTGTVESLTGGSQQNGQIASTGNLPLNIDMNGPEFGVEVAFQL